LGFALPGYSAESLGQDFARPPLTRFAGEATNRLARRRPRVSISFRLASSTWRTEVRSPENATLLGFLHRLDPEHSSKDPSGLCVHLTLGRALLPADQ
jgi:hypothetical protein